MPSTRTSRRRAEFQEREKQQIERRTMAKLRQLAIKIRMDAIAAFRRATNGIRQPRPFAAPR